MLNSEMIRKIELFVHSKPRSMDEIAKHIGKNWRTADRYVAEIEKEHSTISTRIFREGSRGALKIVFWSSIENAKSNIFQDMLEAELLNNKYKDDFSAFDIFQYVPDGRKNAHVEVAAQESYTNLREFAGTLSDAKKELIVFSGNLSFINLKNKDVNIYAVIEGLVKKGVSIKIVCRVDLTGISNVEKFLSLNFKYGRELVEIRHRVQPLRANIIDGRIIRIKEIKEPTGKYNELKKKAFIFYTLKDRDWALWLSRVFWKMFSSSIDAKKRLDELKKLNYKL